MSTRKCEEPGCLNWAAARVTMRTEVRLLCDVHLSRLTRIATGRGVAVEDNRKQLEIRT